MTAADLLQIDRLEEEGPFWHEVSPSDKKFGFANGHSHRCELQVAQEFSHGLLAGESITLQILDQPGNSTAPLLSIADVADLGGLLDLTQKVNHLNPGQSPLQSPKDKNRSDDHSGNQVCRGEMEAEDGCRGNFICFRE